MLAGMGYQPTYEELKPLFGYALGEEIEPLPAYL